MRSPKSIPSRSFELNLEQKRCGSIQVFVEQELLILPISINIIGSDLSILIVRDLGIDRILFYVTFRSTYIRDSRESLEQLGIFSATKSLSLRGAVQACFTNLLLTSSSKQPR